MLMADLTRMAWNARRAGIAFVPGSMLDAFLKAVAPGGTLLVPTFTYDLSDGAAFDVRTTPSISGALARVALEHPAFRRTAHPLHSFAVAGGDSEQLAARVHPGSFDANSPFAHLLRNNARLIAIDLPANDAFTFVHHAEEVAQVPYRRYRTMRFIHTDAQGCTDERTFTLYAKRPGHINAFDALVPLLERAGALQQRELDGSSVMVVELATAHRVVLADIREHGGRAIHRFSLERWGRDMLKAFLRKLVIQRRT
jgi:aminoglycoside 3-N-acetyltransferase